MYSAIFSLKSTIRSDGIHVAHDEEPRYYMSSIKEVNMLRKFFPPVLAAMCFGLFVAGCNNDTASPGDTPPAGVTNEVEAMKAMALSDAFVQNEDQTFSDQSIE